MLIYLQTFHLSPYRSHSLVSAYERRRKEERKLFLNSALSACVVKKLYRQAFSFPHRACARAAAPTALRWTSLQGDGVFFDGAWCTASSPWPRAMGKRRPTEPCARCFFWCCGGFSQPGSFHVERAAARPRQLVAFSAQRARQTVRATRLEASVSRYEIRHPLIYTAIMERRSSLSWLDNGAVYTAVMTFAGSGFATPLAKTSPSKARVSSK